MKRRAFALFCLCISFVLVTESAGVTLGGKVVPKDKMFVFLLIGNSAMSGRDPNADTTIVPHTWNFRLPNTGYGKNANLKDLFMWAPARTPLCIDQRSSGCQDPGTPFLKSLAKYYASKGDTVHHFGVLQNSGANWQMKFFTRGQPQYDSLIPHAKKLKDSVTIAGIVSMLSIVEGTSSNAAATYVANTALTVSQIREDLGMPTLPYIHSCYPVLAQSNYDTTQATVKALMAVEPNIPKTIANSVLIHTNGLSVYLGDGFMSHYDTAGCKAWGQRVTDSIVARKWLEPPVSAIPCGSGKNQHLASRALPQRIYFDGHSLPTALSSMPGGAVVCALSGRTIAKVDQFTRRSFQAAMTGQAPGMYVIRPTRSGR